MKMPKEENIELPLLKVLMDAGGELNIRDAITKTKDLYPDLTPEDKASVLSSGENRLNNRIAWCRQKLVAKGDIDASIRGIWKITERGKRRIETEFNGWRPEYVEIRTRTRRASRDAEEMPFILTSSVSISPEEKLESVTQEIKNNVKIQILKNLMEIDPSIFENLVAQLLEKLEYGSVEVTGRAGDGGIDGICSVDKLGLSKVLFQAKRWRGDVPPTAVRDFIGAIHNNRGAMNGVFITTSNFSQQALKEAERAGNVRLINGDELAELMMSAGLGVKNINLSYPKLDEDYFEGLG